MTQSSSVQAHATTRNALIELFIDLILRNFATTLLTSSKIFQISGPYLGVEIESDDCRDIFDHKIILSEGSSTHPHPIAIWGQTTCYKGHLTAIREPNKTYEIRETLIEALGLRRVLQSKGEHFLTVHFTIGPSSYTYQWFEDLKAACFDFSIYIPHPPSGPSLYDILTELASNCVSDFDIQESFRKGITSNSNLADTVLSVVNRLVEWFTSKNRQNEAADTQAGLLQGLREERLSIAQRLIEVGNTIGTGIKSQAIQLLEGENSTDQILKKTVTRLTSSNPFLGHAIEVQSRWHEWIGQFAPYKLAIKDLSRYLKSLWSADLPDALVLRRLLLRMHSNDSSFYPADLSVKGLTEHNLYSGNHTEEQVEQVIELLLKRYLSSDFNTCDSLFARIRDFGSQVLKVSQRQESANGTNLKPSFYYIEEFLKPEFNLRKFNEVSLDPPIGYHADFTRSRVEPYENLKVVSVPATKRPIAILKAKYFRQQEFARRAKEEAFVGLTLLHRFHNGHFVRKYSNLPLVMFIDCEPDCRAHSHSLIRLITVGWTVFFSPNEMKSYFMELV